MKMFLLSLVMAGAVTGQSSGRAATITVNTTDNASPPTGSISLLDALAAARDGDVIRFDLPGPGPHYIPTPETGYPIIRASDVVIDGHSQPGSKPNKSPLLSANTAQIMVYLDSRGGGRTVLNIDGYGESTAAILPFMGGTNITVRGLGFLARITRNTSEDPAIYCIALGAGASGAHIAGCWFGVDADRQSVFGANAAITGFRYRENGSAFLVDNVIVGVRPGSANPEEQFNVMAGIRLPIAIEGSGVQVSGNFIGVLPSGTNEFNNAVAGLPSEGAIQIGRSDGNVVIGTDGDGVNDEDERNVFAGVLPRTIEVVNGYPHLIEFYGPGERTNVVIAGNYIGVGVDGKTRFTNGVPVVSGLIADARFGSDFDGVSDGAEANVVFNNWPTNLFTAENFARDFFENVGEGAVISMRGNKLVNNFTPPVSPLRENGAFHRNYFAKAIADPAAGILPTLSPSTTATRLIGAIPPGISELFPLTTIDLYLADAAGIALGQALFPKEFPNGFIQGATYLGQFFEGSLSDLDKTPGKFTIDVTALNLPVGSPLTVTVNYSRGFLGDHNPPTLTSLFSNVVLARVPGSNPDPPGPLAITATSDGLSIQFTGALQSAPSVDGAWTDVPNATSPFVIKPDQATLFYRARSL